VGSVLLIGHSHEGRAIAASALGLPLLLSIELFGERQGWGRSGRLAWGLLCIGLLGLYVFLSPSKFDEGEGIRFVILDIAVHMLVAVVVFIGRGRENGFWQFNQRLFIGIGTAFLYSTTLTIGIELALASVDHLFAIDITPDAYTDVAIVIFGIFNTWFFLGIVPRDFDALELAHDYPKGLKFFSQFVLLPLVTLYLLILYLYSAKILLEWRWPNGWVSSLVLGYAVAGILSLLLLHPVRNAEGNRWIGIFSRWFYAALLPMIFLLIFAIWRRISVYGFTERRYLVAILAYWLAGVSAYFLFGRRKRIEVVPATLCILGLVISYGPWGAHAVSVADQTRLVVRMLRDNGILVGGKFHRAADTMNVEMKQRITSVLTYLDNRGALAKVTALGGMKDGNIDAWALADTLGVNPYNRPDGADFGSSLTFEIDVPEVTSVAGYDYLFQFVESRPIARDGKDFRLDDGESVRAVLDSAGRELRLGTSSDTLRFPLDSLLALLKPSSGQDVKSDTSARPVPLILEGRSGRWKARVMIDRLDAVRDTAGSPHPTVMRATIVIGRR
jgi:hypothetical protein